MPTSSTGSEKNNLSVEWVESKMEERRRSERRRGLITDLMAVLGEDCFLGVKIKLEKKVGPYFTFSSCIFQDIFLCSSLNISIAFSFRHVNGSKKAYNLVNMTNIRFVCRIKVHCYKMFQ